MCNVFHSYFGKKVNSDSANNSKSSQRKTQTNPLKSKVILVDVFFSSNVLPSDFDSTIHVLLCPLREFR